MTIEPVLSKQRYKKNILNYITYTEIHFKKLIDSYVTKKLTSILLKNYTDVGGNTNIALCNGDYIFITTSDFAHTNLKTVKEMTSDNLKYIDTLNKYKVKAASDFKTFKTTLRDIGIQSEDTDSFFKVIPGCFDLWSRSETFENFRTYIYDPKNSPEELNRKVIMVLTPIFDFWNVITILNESD